MPEYNSRFYSIKMKEFGITVDLWSVFFLNVLSRFEKFGLTIILNSIIQFIETHSQSVTCSALGL